MLVHEDLGVAATEDSVTPGDTAAGFTAAKIKPTTGIFAGKRAESALIICEDNTVKYTISGTTPTKKAGTNIGLPLQANESYVIRGVENVKNFLVVDDVSGGGSPGIIKAFLFFRL